MSSTAVVAAIISFVVALIAASTAYAFNLELERKRAYQKWTSDQLQYLYGPLQALRCASGSAYEAFLKKYGEGSKLRFETNPSNPKQIANWRNWVLNVFMPLNEKIEKVILENVHLVEDVMPDEFIEFLAHVESFKAVIVLWTKDDLNDASTFEEIREKNLALLDFPKGFDAVIARDFCKLLERRNALISYSHRPAWKILDEVLRGRSSGLRSGSIRS